MTGRAILSSAVALLLAAPAYATINGGLDLSWGTCATQRQVSEVPFDCASSVSGHDDLMGTFYVSVDQDSFIAMDWALHVKLKSSFLPPYWHFEPGGCNDAANGTVYVNVYPRPAALCAGTNEVGPWSPQAMAALGFVPGPGGSGRFVATAFRPVTSPFTLVAGKDYFGFRMRFVHGFAAESGGPCAGCPTGGCIVWNSASFDNIRSGRNNPGPFVVDGPGRTNNAAFYNNGIHACFVTPTRNATWGQIKSLYR